MRLLQNERIFYGAGSDFLDCRLLPCGQTTDLAPRNTSVVLQRFVETVNATRTLAQMYRVVEVCQSLFQESVCYQVTLKHSKLRGF